MNWRSLMVLWLASGMLVSACKGKGSSVGDAEAAAEASVPPRPTSVAAVLNEHPEVLLQSSAWEHRVRAHILDPISADACPSVGKVTGDEFERRAAISKAVAGCKEINDRALDLMKKCPSVRTLDMDVSQYDFAMKRFELTGSDGDAAYVSNEGHAWFRADRSLLSWSGVFPDRDRPSVKQDRAIILAAGCSGPLIGSMSVLAGLVVPLPMSEPDGKALRDALGGSQRVRADIAYVLDGGSAQDHLPCGTMTPKVATGRVIALRLQRLPVQNPPSIVRDWMAVSEWTSEPVCATARGFFGAAELGASGMPEVRSGALDSGSPAAAATEAQHEGSVKALTSLLSAPRSWRVQAAANGAKPRYDLPCTTEANGAFSCRDKCGENSGEIRVATEGDRGAWQKPSDATHITLSFKRLCGRANERDVTYRVANVTKDSFRLEGAHDWQVWSE